MWARIGSAIKGAWNFVARRGASAAEHAAPAMDEAAVAARSRASQAVVADAEAIIAQNKAKLSSLELRSAQRAARAENVGRWVRGTAITGGTATGGYFVAGAIREQKEKKKESTGNPIIDGLSDVANNIKESTGITFGLGSLIIGAIGAVIGGLIPGGGPMIAVLLGVVGSIGGQPLMNALGLFKKDEAASQQAGAAGTQQAEGHTTEEQRTAGQTEEIGQLSPGSTPTPTPAQQQQQTGQQQPQSQHTR